MVKKPSIYRWFSKNQSTSVRKVRKESRDLRNVAEQTHGSYIGAQNRNKYVKINSPSFVRSNKLMKIVPRKRELHTTDNNNDFNKYRYVAPNLKLIQTTLVRSIRGQNLQKDQK
ncbi:hypothetical protein DMENIID0001_072170 [Sergentomyia squamirostris]